LEDAISIYLERILISSIELMLCLVYESTIASWWVCRCMQEGYMHIYRAVEILKWSDSWAGLLY